MNYLMDTHTLLWLMFRSELLSSKARTLAEDAEHLYVSVVSMWEIAIKQSIGKLAISKSVTDIAHECLRQEIRLLDIKPEHCDKLKVLPLIHGDPFDRMIVAQAVVGEMTVISKDTEISRYPVSCVW